MIKDSKKPISTKTIITLVGLIVVLIALISVLLFSGNSTEPLPKINQPIKQHLVLNQVRPEGNVTQIGDIYLEDNIDRYFMTKAPINKSENQQVAGSPTLPKLPFPNNGAVVSLPSLMSPSQLQHGNGGNLRPSNVIAGMPTPISLPVNYQYVSVNGIACDDGKKCRALTSVGSITIGSVIGGGNYEPEKVVLVTMNGIKTDKRFISY